MKLPGKITQLQQDLLNDEESHSLHMDVDMFIEKVRERRIDLSDDTLRILFDMVDEDKSGTIERDELHSLTKLLPKAKDMVVAEEAEEVFEAEAPEELREASSRRQLSGREEASRL